MARAHLKMRETTEQDVRVPKFIDDGEQRVTKRRVIGDFANQAQRDQGRFAQCLLCLGTPFLQDSDHRAAESVVVKLELRGSCATGESGCEKSSTDDSQPVLPLTAKFSIP